MNYGSMNIPSGSLYKIGGIPQVWALSSSVSSTISTVASNSGFWNSGGGGGSVSGSSYTRSFTNGDLTSGTLVVTHNLNQKVVNVSVGDGNDKDISPSDLTYTSLSSLLLDVSTFTPITGTWNISVIKSGAGASYVPLTGTSIIYGSITISGDFRYGGNSYLTPQPTAAGNGTLQVDKDSGLIYVMWPV